MPLSPALSEPSTTLPLLLVALKPLPALAAPTLMPWSPVSLIEALLAVRLPPLMEPPVSVTEMPPAMAVRLVKPALPPVAVRLTPVPPVTVYRTVLAALMLAWPPADSALPALLSLTWLPALKVRHSPPR